MGKCIVRVAEEMFSEFVTQGNVFSSIPGRRVIVAKGLPRGSKLISMSLDLFFVFGQIALMFEHPDLPDHEPGSQIPEAKIEYAMEDENDTGEHVVLVNKGE